MSLLLAARRAPFGGATHSTLFFDSTHSIMNRRRLDLTTSPLASLFALALLLVLPGTAEAQRGGASPKATSVQPVAVAPVQYADLLGVPGQAADTNETARPAAPAAAEPRPMSDFAPDGAAPMGSPAARAAGASAPQRTTPPQGMSPQGMSPQGAPPTASPRSPVRAQPPNESSTPQRRPPEYFPGAVPAHAPAGSYPQKELEDAARHYAQDAEASSVTTGSVMYVPYEKQVPTIKGSPMHFTLIELAPGEYVVDTFLGDPMRWNVEIGSTGSQQRFTQIVSVNPLQCGPASSDLALTTNMGRVYRVHLRAVECDIPAGDYPASDAHTRHVRFWYPDGTVEGRQMLRSRHEPPSFARSQGRMGGAGMPPPAPGQYGAAPAGTSQAGYSKAGAPTSSGGQFAFSPQQRSVSSLDLRKMNTEYEVKTDRRFPCEPALVADDGERTYIRFPADKALCNKTYPLYVETPDRELQLTNYSVYGSTYVVEGTPMKIVVLYREGSGREQRVEIVNRKLRDAFRRDRRR